MQVKALSDELKNCELLKLAHKDYRYGYWFSKYNEKYFLSSANHSFVLQEKENILAVVLLAISEKLELNFYTSPIGIFIDPSLAPQTRLDCESQIIQEINSVIKKKSAKSIQIAQADFVAAEFYSKISMIKNDLVAYIDLTEDEASILRRMRKSYRSLINWGKANLRVEVISKDNLDRKIFDEIKAFHIQTSGRQTRSDETWDLQFDAIKNGEAFVTISRLPEGKLVSASYIIEGTETCYYGVGVYDRELMGQKVAIGHWNLVRAILEAKARGRKTFILGSISNQSSEKESAIAKFKKGFTNKLAVESSIICDLSLP